MKPDWLTLILILSLITSSLMQKWKQKKVCKKIPNNLLVLFISCFTSLLGILFAVVCYNLLFNVSILWKYIVVTLLVWGVSMFGYDKTVQTLLQIKQRKG